MSLSPPPGQNRGQRLPGPRQKKGYPKAKIPSEKGQRPNVVRDNRQRVSSQHVPAIIRPWASQKRENNLYCAASGRAGLVREVNNVGRAGCWVLRYCKMRGQERLAANAGQPMKGVGVIYPVNLFRLPGLVRVGHERMPPGSATLG